MELNYLMDSFIQAKQDVPTELAIFELRQGSVEEKERRLRKLLKTGGDACKRNFERGQWQTFEDHTQVLLPSGARAVLYHASGAFKLTSGLAPLDAVFKETESKKQLTDRCETLLEAIGLRETLGRNETLKFERLWQTKACAADRSGKRTEPTLCRAIGAFRHYVDGVAVLGPASTAVQVAGGGQFDMLSVLTRSPGEVLERARVVPPERAAHQLLQQLAARLDGAKGEFRAECREGMRFGYLSLSKRKHQRLLAPVYMATIDIEHEKVNQGMVLAVAATDKSYLPLNPPGQENLTPSGGKLTAKRCC